jgi:uncharacterized protein (TIGR02145 family)
MNYAIEQVSADASSKSSFTDPRDGNVYRTVKIGGQVWMAENLRYKIDGSWCYGNDESNCQKYGRLYDWEAAKKACPPGWHLPTRGEWTTLIENSGGKAVECVVGRARWRRGGKNFAFRKLKAKSGWGLDGNGTDDYGFSALPGGIRCESFGREFFGAGGHGDWWTSEEYDAEAAYYQSIDCSYIWHRDAPTDGAALDEYCLGLGEGEYPAGDKVNAVSVRCVLDAA